MYQALTLAAEHSEGSKLAVGIVAIAVVVGVLLWLAHRR